MFQPRHQHLPGKQPRLPAEIRIHPQNLQRTHTRRLRDGKERVARLHRHGLLRPQNEKRLPHRQPVRFPQAVVASNEARRNAILPSDGVERLPGAYHMNLHSITSFKIMPRRALAFRFYGMKNENLGGGTWI